MAVALVLALLAAAVKAAEGDLACNDTTLITCGDCISYRLVANTSTDTAQYSGTNQSIQCTQCKNDRRIGSASHAPDIKDNKLVLDTSGCGSKNQNSRIVMNPLILGLIIAGSILGFLLLVLMVAICCCCCKSQEGGAAAGQRTKPKHREKRPGGNFNSSKYYNQSQIEGGENGEAWKKNMLKSKNSVDLENSNSGYEVSEPNERPLEPPVPATPNQINIQMKEN